MKYRRLSHKNVNHTSSPWSEFHLILLASRTEFEETEDTAHLKAFATSAANTKLKWVGTDSTPINQLVLKYLTAIGLFDWLILFNDA